MMRFSFVTIYTKDMDRSLQFYNGLLGLSVVRRHPVGNGELAFLGMEGEPQLEIISGAGHTYSGFSIGIEVPDLDEAVAMLAAEGYPVIRGPIQPNPHTRFSFILDPDGVEVELIEYKKTEL